MACGTYDHGNAEIFKRDADGQCCHAQVSGEDSHPLEDAAFGALEFVGWARSVFDTFKSISDVSSKLHGAFHQDSRLHPLSTVGIAPRCVGGS
jgi:hypothetical protein